MSILELKNVSYVYKNRYQSVTAVDGVNFSFDSGKVYAIVGKSGSGKTTLLSMLSGLDLPTDGEVLYNGVSTAKMDRDRYRREDVAVIYQNFNLFPLMTVRENIMYPVRLQKHSKAEARAKASQDELDQTVIILQDAKEQLEAIQGELEESQMLVIDLRSEKDAMRADLALALAERDALQANSDTLSQQINALQAQISQKQTELNRLSGQYNSLLSSSQQNDALLTQYKNELALYESRLSEAQAQLEQMLGVKTQIIRSLSDAFKRNNIQVDVDEETGAIVLPGAALFDSGKTELKPEGMRYLDRFLPVYLSVLLSNEFRPYVAEIIIEGHTDSTAKQGYDAFLYNLELSQERALAVASYVLDDTYMRNTLRLSNSGIAAFKKVISAAGRSFSSLKYNADGSENKEASRRVEIKFSLIDEESVYATRQIMGS